MGANAVNGVINIVTKHSKQTQGLLVSSSVDTDMGYTTTVQYGGSAAPGTSYRIFGKASYWEPFTSQSGTTLPNSFGLPQAGMRMDWAAWTKDTFTLEGGAMNGTFSGLVLPQHYSCCRTGEGRQRPAALEPCVIF